MKAVPWLKGRAANSATLAAESLAQPSHAEEQPGTASTASTSSSVCDGTSSVVKTPDSIGSHRKTQVVYTGCTLVSFLISVVEYTNDARVCVVG